MKWVTRERPKIDRIACPWLIIRFIDQTPEFLYVPAASVIQVAQDTGAIPYDVPGVEMTHDGDLCSFDAFLKKCALVDPALQQLAVIVRGADTFRLDLAPQSAGLYALSLGLSKTVNDDHEMLGRGKVHRITFHTWGDFILNPRAKAIASKTAVGHATRGTRTALWRERPPTFSNLATATSLMLSFPFWWFSNRP